MSQGKATTDYNVFHSSINEPGTYAHYQLLPESANEPPPFSPAIPTVTSLNPSTAVHGAANFTMHVLGKGFGPWSAIMWNGVAQPTTLVSGTDLSMTVPSSTATRQNYNVAVKNGSFSSGTLSFRMT